MAKDKKSEMIVKLSERPEVTKLVGECVACCMAFSVAHSMHYEDVFDCFMAVVHNTLLQFVDDEDSMEKVNAAKEIVAELEKLEKLVEALHKARD